jgi:phage terminase small subunit
MTGDGLIKKAKFVEALVGGADVGAAAVAAGRSERTGRRWLCEPDVRAVLSEALAGRLRALNARRVDLASDALDVLAEVLKGAAIAPYVRVAAAKAVLDAALRLSEFTDIEARIAEIERRIAAKGGLA